MKFLFLLLLIPGWLTYTDATNKFTIQYPKEWAQKPVPNAIAFLSPQTDPSDNFQENVNVMVQDLSAQPMTLEQFTELSKKQIVDNFGAKAIVSQTPATISGQKATRMIYTMNYQGRSLKIKEYWFIKGKSAYLITYTAQPETYAQYEKTATDIINSFVLTK